MTGFSPKEKKLLKVLQKNFPLDSRPFKKIGEIVGFSEEEVLQILSKWEKAGILRQISAIFEPALFGHSSSLFALKVPEERLNKAIKIINSHKGVTHNYLREGDYNTWFVLVVPPEKDLIKEASKIVEQIGLRDFLYLPVIKTFKISTVFSLDSMEEGKRSERKKGDRDAYFEERSEPEEDFVNDFKGKKEFTQEDIRFVKALQEPLPLVKEPFSEVASLLNCKDGEIFEWIEAQKKRKALRRFGALLKHNKIGLKENVMFALEVDGERIGEVAEEIIRLPGVSHCYQRRSYPEWPYNLYFMVHFKDGEEIRDFWRFLKRLPVKKIKPLKTLKELKKERLKLFYC